MVPGRQHVAQRQQQVRRRRPAARAAPRPGCRPRAGPAAPRPAPRRGPGSPNTPPSTQDVVSPDRQYSHVPSDQVKGEITRSPGRTVRTSGADVGDHAEELVADPLAGLPLPVPPVRPEVGAAQGGRHDPDHRVGGQLHLGVGHVLDPDVAGPLEHSGAHTPGPYVGPGGYDSVASGSPAAGHVRALRRAPGRPRPSPRAARSASSRRAGRPAGRPGQRLRPGPGHAGVDQRVQHQPLGLPQPGHHRHGQRGEQLPGAAGRPRPRRPSGRTGAARRRRSPSARPGCPRGTG